MIWESFLDKTVDSVVLKKKINTPQFARLERTAATRAKEAKVETKKAANIPEYANIEAEKAPTDTEKATLDTEEAKNYVKEAKPFCWRSKGHIIENQKGLWRSYS